MGNDDVKAIKDRRGGVLLNLDRVLLKSLPIAIGWNAMFGAIRSKTVNVPPRCREACILFIAVLCGAEYEWQQHEREFLSCGGTPQMMALLRARNIDTWENDLERCCLKLCLEMTIDVKVKDETARAVIDRIGDTGYVEIVTIIGGYNMVARVLIATGVPLEEQKE